LNPEGRRGGFPTAIRKGGGREKKGEILDLGKGRRSWPSLSNRRRGRARKGQEEEKKGAVVT